MNASARSGRRLLIARPDHLGDVVLALPAAMVLRELWPDASIAMLTAPATADVALRCPAVGGGNGRATTPSTAEDCPPGWGAVVRREAERLRGRVDVALLPRADDPWSGALLAAADIPVRIGYAHPRTLRWLTDALPLPGRRHVTQLALTLAAVAAGHEPSPLNTPPAWSGEPWVVPTVSDEAETRAALRSRQVAGDYVVLHPGSGWPLKHWPAERWGMLAAALCERHALAPLVTGSASESELIDAIVHASGGAARSLSGTLSLGGLAALLRAARLVVATDSGPLHLAVAVGAPVVGLYGPADPREFGPWAARERQRVVHAELPCSPCRRLDTPPCGARESPLCVTQVSVGDMLAAVAHLLASTAGARAGQCRVQS